MATKFHNLSAPVFNPYTTAERDALNAQENMLLFNSDTNQFEVYLSGVWLGVLVLNADGNISAVQHGIQVGDLHPEYASISAPREITTAWLLKSGAIIKPLEGDPPVGAIAIQRKTSSGAPTHSSELAVLCWVQPDDDIYINNDGDTGWTKQAKASDLHAQTHTLASHSTKPHTALTGITATQHHSNSNDHAEVHGSAGHTGKVGERQVEILIPLSDPLPAATNNATQDDDYLYKKPYNAARRINKWYVRFESVLAAAATFELRKNGTLITGASIAISASARDAAVDSFTETILADGDYLEVWQTVGNAEAIGGRAYIYGDEDVMSAIS